MKNTIDYCKKKLEDKKFRITPQRLSIFCFLVESDIHPSAEKVYKKVRKDFPNISFDTVNRTLLSLVDKGLIKLVEGGHGPRRFDANLKPHYHFRCLYCRRIIDFECDAYDQIKIPDEIKDKFYVLKQKILLEGICNGCNECNECFKNNQYKGDYPGTYDSLTK